MAKINGIALGSVFAGSIFLYAGIRGYSVMGALQAIVQGNDPRKAPKASQIAGTPLGSGDSSTPVPASPAPASTTPAVSGGTFSQAQCEQLWISKGGDPNQARNAGCHAMQESGGRSWVTSPNPDGGTNVGLGQLDTKGKGAGYTVAQLQNPDTNARITIMQTRNGTDWSAWATPGC
jgi:hypothetical protein